MGRFRQELSVWQPEDEVTARAVDFPPEVYSSDGFVTLDLGKGSSGVLLYLKRNQEELRAALRALAKAQSELHDIAEDIADAVRRNE